ncbi:hypothetical protein OSTOST_12510 [Ostertagia ostertagi]
MLATLPPNVKGLFPKENIEFAESIDENEAKILKEVFDKHSTFDEVGEMISAVEAKSPELAKRMRDVLSKNCSRLNGLSPSAIDYSKKELSSEDQASLKKSNPDVQF